MIVTLPTNLEKRCSVPINKVCNSVMYLYFNVKRDQFYMFLYSDKLLTNTVINTTNTSVIITGLTSDQYYNINTTAVTNDKW